MFLSVVYYKYSKTSGNQPNPSAIQMTRLGERVEINNFFL